MSSRTEHEKRRSQEAGSPLIKHSMNQRSLTRTSQGERRMAPPRKLAMRERREMARDQYEEEKLGRIRGRVDLAFQDDERIRLDILEAELRFLERRGINVAYPGSLYQEGLEYPGIIEVAIAVGRR